MVQLAAKGSQAIEIPIENNMGEAEEKMVLFGKPKVGKTGLAATMLLPSGFDMGMTQKAAKAHKIKALWLSFDPNAIDVLKARRVGCEQVPCWKIFQGDFRLGPTMRALREKVVDKVINEGIQLVVPDSITEFDSCLLRYYERVESKVTGAGKRDSYTIGRQVGYDHADFRDWVCALPCHVAFIAHSKVASEASMRKAKAESLPGAPSNVVLDLYYTACQNVYRRGMSVIASIQEEKDGKRWMYTQTHGGFEAGSRFSNLHETKELPHLGKFFAKIRKGLK